MNEPSASFVISADARSKVYDPMIFGGFLEHFDSQIYGGVFDPGSPLADERGFRLDVIEALKEFNVPVIRWPGGCFVDAYHWRKGVGPVREPYGDFRWGVIESNTFGTHEFVELCRRIGAEPYICHNGVCEPQENVDWVDYCNASEGPMAELRKANGYPEPLNVKFWSVGNERSDRAYIDRVRDTAKSMKSSDPTLQVMASAAHGGDRAIVSDYLFEEAAEYLDLLSIHNYWLDRGKVLPRNDYLTAISKSEMPGRYISDTIEALRDAGQLGRLTISFDEWNLRAWQHPGFPREGVEDFDDPEVCALVEQRHSENDLAEQYTMADALFSASFLNACLRHSEHVTMANVAPLVNTRGPLFVHPQGIVKRTSFHAMTMLANLLQERVVEAEVQSEPLTQDANSVATVDGIATVDGAGETWSLALINRHPLEAVACTVTLPGRALNGSFKATVLTGDSPDAFNDIEHPDRVVPKAVDVSFQDGVVSLPPHSLMVVDVLG
jgi:alpha-L-arabinofuranosidase